MLKKSLIKATKATAVLVSMIMFLSFVFPISASYAAETQKSSDPVILDVTQEVVALGNPFTKATFANNVWDMQTYNGRIYFGHGDYDKNAGPIPVIYYDPANNKFVTQYTVNDESIEKFKVLNGELYIPGIDSRAAWSYGNFYHLNTSDTWEAFSTIPGGVHVFDIAYYDGKLYAATGVETANMGILDLQVSADNGRTWSSAMPQVNKPTQFFLSNRCYSLFEINGNLYGAGRLSGQTTYQRVVEIDATGSHALNYTSDLLPGIDKSVQYTMNRTVNFNNQLVYLLEPYKNYGNVTGNALYTLTSVAGTGQRLSFPQTDATPTDSLIRDQVLYALTFIKNAQGAYTNIVYQSEDLSNWNEMFRFDSATFARSFEELNGDFYFGLGSSSDAVSTATGNILKVAKESFSAPSLVEEVQPPILGTPPSAEINQPPVEEEQPAVELAKIEENNGVYSLKDNFTGYAEGSNGAPNWQTGAASWKIRNGYFENNLSTTSFATVNTPISNHVVVESEIIIEETTVADATQYKSAGIAIHSDLKNYWRLALTEEPDSLGTKRYIELKEMFNGVWGADFTGNTKLKSSESFGSGFSWETGKSYTLKLTLTGNNILGAVYDDAGTLKWQKEYVLEIGKSLQSGKAALTSKLTTVKFGNVNAIVKQMAEIVKGKEVSEPLVEKALVEKADEDFSTEADNEEEGADQQDENQAAAKEAVSAESEEASTSDMGQAPEETN
jgi:hypothetical protein